MASNHAEKTEKSDPVVARRMASRDPREAHRVATPLELLFDLCFVAAVAQASAKLHHGLASGHAAEAVGSYVIVFFAIWWAWMNFTWFASAFDTDDVAYRLVVLVEIAGALTIAAGIPSAFEARDLRIVTYGYAIVRVGLVVNWLRAARASEPCRATALRYAAGLIVVQAGWLVLLSLPQYMWLAGWFALVAAELIVPVWAERARRTPWHPHHIAERYGLFTIIVLGESVLSAALAIQSAVSAGGLTMPILAAIVGSLLILFSMWWIYFDEPAHDLLVSSRAAFLWGYGHLAIFAATAAVGAGLAVAAEASWEPGHRGWMAGAVVAIPVCIYLAGVCVMHVLPIHGNGLLTIAFAVAIVGSLAAAFAPWPVLAIGLVLATLCGVKIVTTPKTLPRLGS